MEYKIPLSERSTEDLEKAIPDFDYVIDRNSPYASIAWKMRADFKAELERRKELENKEKQKNPQ